MRLQNGTGGLWLACLALGGGACGEDAGAGGDAVAHSADAARGAGTVRGRVTRSAELAEDGDGRGVLHIGLTEECLASEGTAPVEVLMFTIDDADLSQEGASIPFEMRGLPDGTYAASCWLDDVDNPAQDEDLPGKGDLAMFQAATPVCVPVTITQGGVVDDVVLDLNYRMPFDLTGRNSDERGGVLDETGGSGVRPDEIDSADPNTYTVTVNLTRSVPPGEGGDAVGKGTLTLSERCFEPDGSTPPPLYVASREGVDLSEQGAVAQLTFEGVKNGLYQLNGYLDDVTPETPDRPLPSTGDLVRFGGFGPGCVEVAVNGRDVEVDFDLNFVMTWDLND